jgi:hypothetical protein
LRKDSDQDWQLDVHSSGRLTGGRALANVMAVVRRTDGSTYEFSWPAEVQLVQPDTVFRRLRQDVKGFRDFATAEDPEPNSDRARRDHNSSSWEGPCQ